MSTTVALTLLFFIALAYLMLNIAVIGVCAYCAYLLLKACLKDMKD